MFRIILILIAILCVLLVVINFIDQNQTSTVIRASIPITAAMSHGNSSGFKRAIEPRSFSFPDDHGPHPEFQSEWWYFTGNLKTKENQHFGYQLTFFRQTISKNPIKRDSKWASNEIYMGHFAITDVSRKKFYSFERLSRSVHELAGAQSNPFKIWLEDWKIEETSRNNYQGTAIFKIVARAEDVTLNLIISKQKPEILQGEKGLSKKGPEPGNASYYYSLTRLKSDGKITIDQKEFVLSGWSWMDREWSTNVLAQDQIGWDWFSLQLDNNLEIMYYQLGKRNGSVDPFNAGTIIFENGKSKSISVNDIDLTVKETWTNPQGVQYPSGWNLLIPNESLELEIVPYLKNQELNVSIQYWEGAVKVKGKKDNEAISGAGYVELTGYKEQALLKK